MKIAIRVLTEWDRENVIPFFEKHFPNCNGLRFSCVHIDIGDVLCISDKGILNAYTNDEYWLNYHKEGELSDYTIIEGVPKDLELPKVEETKTREQELEECLKEICYQLTGEQECEEELEKSLGIRLSSLVLQAKHLLNQK